jgi:acyl-CoA synthetase (AMP-forming)/AMP-acid ligase II
MILLDKINQNTSLKIIDAKTNKKFILKDIVYDLSLIEKNDKQLVFLYCKNQVHSVGMYFSLLKANVAIALLNEELDVNLKLTLEQNYQPQIIIDITRKTIKGYREETVKSSVDSAKMFILEKEIELNINDNIKLLLSTSGTTGSPKFVKLSEKNLYENAKSISNYLPINSRDITPLNLPFFYSYGLSVLHTNALNGGAIVCNTDDVLSKVFWNQFEEFGFTSIAGVPFVYEMLDRIGFRKKQYPSLRYISQAGGNLNQKTKQKFLEYAKVNTIDFYVMYGQTEATARISYVSPKDLENKITSIGKPISNGELSIDLDTQELLYKGPNVFGGYATKSKELSIWEDIEQLHTGDLAIKDEDGFYFITGRMKRFIKVFGNRVNLDELERFLKRKTDETNFACIGVKDKNVVIFTDKEVDFGKIKKITSDELKIHSSVLKHKVVNEFPLTSNGKVNYKALGKIYEF